MKLQSLPSLCLRRQALHEIAGELGIPVFKAPLSEEQESNLPPCCLIIAPLKGNGVPNERVAEKTKDYEKDILKSKFEKRRLDLDLSTALITHTLRVSTGSNSAAFKAYPFRNPLACAALVCGAFESRGRGGLLNSGSTKLYKKVPKILSQLGT